MSKAEVDKFIEENRVVRDWLHKYAESTSLCNVQILCRFFKWLRVKRDIHLSFEGLLNEQTALLRNRDSLVGDHSRHLRLVLDFCRDNPDFKGLSDGRKYIMLEKYLNIYSVPPRDILAQREMEQHEMRHFTEKLMKDPRFVGRFLDFLGENLTVNLPEGKVPLEHVVTPKTLTLQRPDSHNLKGG